MKFLIFVFTFLLSLSTSSAETLRAFTSSDVSRSVSETTRLTDRPSTPIQRVSLTTDLALSNERINITGLTITSPFRRVNVIPDINFESNPPSPLCSLGLGGGFEAALGLTEGYTDQWGNLLNVQTVMAILSQITPSMDQATKKILTLLLRSVWKPASASLDNSTTHTEEAVSTYRAATTFLESTPSAGKTVERLYDDALKDTEKDILGLSEEDHWQLDGTIGRDSPYAVFADRLDWLKGYLHEPVEIVRAAGTTDDMAQTTEAASIEVDSGIRAVGRSFLNGAFSMVQKVSDLVEVIGQLTPNASRQDLSKFNAFVSSVLVNGIFQGIIEPPAFDGKIIAVKAPVKNVGDSICDAADDMLRDDSIDAETSNQFICTVITAIGESIGCETAQSPQCDGANRTSVPMTTCDIPSTGPVDPSTVKLDIKLNTLKASESDPQLMQREGLIAYFLFRGVQAVQRWASVQAICGLAEPNPRQAVPGWTMITSIDASEPAANLLQSSPYKKIPLGSISVSDESSCNLLAIIRGTKTDYEWALNFDAALHPMEALGEDVGSVHSGFYKLASAWIPTFENLLEEKLALCGEVNLTITGHSLGGGVAEVMALFLGAKYSWLGLKLDLITFAAPKALDHKATESLRRVAEIRSWFAELDAIPKLPCASKYLGLPRCESRTNFGNYGTGYDIYAEHINGIEIAQSSLTRINAKFGQYGWGDIALSLWPRMSVSMSELQIPSTLQFIANHVCAYACYLSSQYCISDSSRAWMCHACAFS